MKKKLIIIGVLLLISFFPIVSCNASISGNKGHDLDKEWSGYNCYILGADVDVLTYNLTFTFREYEGMSTKNSSDRVNPQCLDGSYQGERYPVINYSTCQPNLYFIHTTNSSSNGCGNDTCYSATYRHWKTTISDTNMFSSYPTDCIAAGAMLNAMGGNAVNPLLFIEAGKNSDFYDESEINHIKESLNPDFNDDTNFCFARRYGMGDGDVMFYFGHPYRIYNFYGDDGDGYSNLFIPGDGDNYWINTDDIEDVDGAISSGLLDVSYFPDPYYTKTIEEIQSEFGNDYGEIPKAYLVVDANGKMITDQSECLTVTKTYLDGVYSSYGTDTSDLATQSLVDSTAENPDRVKVDLDFAALLIAGYNMNKALDVCAATGETTSEYKCYKYTNAETVRKPPYNTTVWSNKNLSACNFELMDKWDYDDCKDADLEKTSEHCAKLISGNKTCYNITNSGYNGVADFHIIGDNSTAELKCLNYRGLHFVYRIGVILAPIITIMFVTFDLIRTIMSGDQKKVSAFRSKLTRRIIALTLLIILPIIVSILVNTLSKNNKIKDTSILKYVVKGCD